MATLFRPEVVEPRRSFRHQDFRTQLRRDERVEYTTEKVSVSHDPGCVDAESGCHQRSVNDVALRMVDETLQPTCRPRRHLIDDEEVGKKVLVRVRRDPVDLRGVVDRLVIAATAGVERVSLEVVAETDPVVPTAALLFQLLDVVSQEAFEVPLESDTPRPPVEPECDERESARKRELDVAAQVGSVCR